MTDTTPGDAERAAIIEEDTAERADLKADAERELTAERFGPLPARLPGASLQRARAAAAIHAYANLVAADLDIPVPWFVRGHCHADAAQLQAIADQRGLAVYGRDRPQVSYYVTEDRDFSIDVIVSVPPADRPL